MSGKPLTTDVFGYHKATVTWYCNAAKPSKRSRVQIDLGYCSYGKGVAFIAAYDPNSPITEQALKPMVIHDVFIHVEKKLCEDALWCINLDCPCCRAEVKHFKRYGVHTKKDLEKWHVIFEKIRKDLNLHEGNAHMITCYEKTPIYITRKKK